MIERYFIKHQTQDRIRTSWLGEPIQRYVTWLHEQQYAARNVYRRVPILVRFAHFFRGTPPKTHLARRCRATQMAQVDLNIMCPGSRAPPSKKGRCPGQGT
jgi:hypothetical protein